MRSEVMGKTMAMLMVIALIATGIALLPASVQAGAYLIEGQVLDIESDDPVSGANVFITVNSVPAVYANTTTDINGMFSKWVNIDAAYSFDLEFTKIGYQDLGPVNYPDTTFNGTTADTGVTLLTAKSVVAGIVYEMDSTTPIQGVEVTFEGLDEEVFTNADGEFSTFTDNNEITLQFNKDGYYSSSALVSDVDSISEDDVYYMEKIVPTPTIRVWGIIFEDGTQDIVDGATVSISEGDDKWITAISDEDGYYEMLAYPGNYQIKVAKNGYFTTFDNSYFFSVPTDKSVRQDMTLTPIGDETKIVDGTVSSSAGGAIDGAVVYLHSQDGRYVNHTTTNGAGYYEMNFYDDSFVLEVTAKDFFTNASATVTDTATVDVDLDPVTKDFNLYGFVYDSEDDSVIEGATVTLYSKNYLYTNSTTTGPNGHYLFNVSTSSDYAVVVNADGYQSIILNADNIADDTFLQAGLAPSGMDIITTQYTFVDWDTVQVHKFKTLCVDNVTARLNADLKWGMGDIGLELNDGQLSSGEVDDWENYLAQKGVEERNTKGFMTIDNHYFQLNTTSYEVSIQGAEGSLGDPGTTIYINSSYNYTLMGELDDMDADMFELVFNASYDTEFEDRIYEIILPMDPKFEMTENFTETNFVDITGYNNPITIDPFMFEEESEIVTMTIERSMNGTAKASIVDGDHYYVLNSTYDNYTVIVAQGGSGGFDTTVTFSAEGSTDKIGDISKANFTWDFGDGDMGYGMEVEHNFTSVSGDVTVTLDITETGGNTTTREILVKVDSEAPSAGISIIATDDENVTLDGTTLTIDEDMPLVFSGVKFSDAEGMDNEVIAGSASSDDLKADDGKGLIEKWYWSWGEEGTPDETITMEGSNNISHMYNEPGTYELNLIVTDVVGHESANKTWTVVVNDIEIPSAAFIITDNESATVTEVVEDIEFYYNASASEDNYDDLEDLSFTWIFDDDGTITNKTGLEVSYTFSEVGDYNVTLIVTDSSGNEANSTQIVHVNLGERPNILMKVGSMVFDPEEPTAGSTVTITVNLTNDGEEDASSIMVTFYIRNADGTDTEIGSDTIATIAVGDDASASIDWKPSKKGEFSIWANASCSGEHSSQYWDNKIDDFSLQTINVAEASWVLPAIVGGIIAVIVVVFFGFRYFMQSGTEADKSGEKRKKR